MVILEADRAIAARMFKIAVAMVEARELNGTTRELAYDALHHPGPSTIRALLTAGRGQEWLPSVIDALTEVAIAAAQDVLGDDNAE